MNNHFKILVASLILLFSIGCLGAERELSISERIIGQLGPEPSTGMDLVNFVLDWGYGEIKYSSIKNLKDYKEKRGLLSDSAIPAEYIDQVRAFDKAATYYLKWTKEFDRAKKKIIDLNLEYQATQKKRFQNNLISKKVGIYKVSVLNAYYDYIIDDLDDMYRSNNSIKSEELGVQKIINDGILKYPRMLTTYLKIQIFVENISTNRIGRPNVYSVIPYNATNNDGNIVREYITIPYYGFSDNFQNEYKTEGLLKKSYYKDGIRPGDNDNWEFNFSRNQSPLDDISFFNVEFKKEIFGKSIILKIPRQMLVKPDVQKINTDAKPL